MKILVGISGLAVAIAVACAHSRGLGPAFALALGLAGMCALFYSCARLGYLDTVGCEDEGDEAAEPRVIFERISFSDSSIGERACAQSSMKSTVQSSMSR